MDRLNDNRLDGGELQDQSDHAIHFDFLTGLPTRALFCDILKDVVSGLDSSLTSAAVIFIDLDNFKNINDSMGNHKGDQLLIQFSDRLNQCVGGEGIVGRMGGDQFAIILMRSICDSNGIILLIKKIRNVLSCPFFLDDDEAIMTASFGIADCTENLYEPMMLLQYAEMAMCKAKEAGGDTYLFFTQQMNIDILMRIEIERGLRKAIKNEEFILYYQPKVRLNSGQICGVEALLRWQRPGHGLISPDKFIPILEETGLIIPVGTWIIETVCRQIATWIFSDIGAIPVSINVVAQQFTHGDLYFIIEKELTDNNIPSNLLEIEMTESALIIDLEYTVSILEKLKLKGVQVSIDDFGTGYSSLSSLRKLPINKLKIDIAFIREITTNSDDAAIVILIIHLAHLLKLEVIAEGVETASQLSYLRRHHCDQIQGFYFSCPLGLKELENLIIFGKNLPFHDDKMLVGPETLLLIDDDPHILRALQRLFRQDGYRILTAQSAAAGFELLALNEVQVVMCDQRMPVMSGAVFFDKIKELYPHIIRIILSGYTDLDSVIDSINHGDIYRFYTKPWDNVVLRDNLRQAFHHYWQLHESAR